ncbi:MAG: thioredoxin domain-containing protein [Flavisolibacter sp.]
MHSYTNRLAKESSPYLLQHAHNPVDWYPWGDEAFERAKLEDKPVLVSIGYAACHWCHVMERESFENPEVAALMNENFINIKVDREERPDVDHVYMDALHAIEGGGGWPLNVFLTPERKPFFGGTYFPPQRAFNRSSWTEILTAISKAFRERREEIELQADNLTKHLETSNIFGAAVQASNYQGMEEVHNAFQAIMKTADRDWGGFGKAPKFPQTYTIVFLLRYAHLEKNDEALQQALVSLDKMIQGGIYDQVGGGFSRYSTDREWLAPHFEKMLYDNALILIALADALQLTGNNHYRRVIDQTVNFVQRELMHPEGGFFSALDADSEGIEGKFYVWDKEEVDQLLGTDAELFSDYFDIRTGGNWEGRSILRILKPLKDFALAKEIEVNDLENIIRHGLDTLLRARTKRVRPQLDDKVIIGWNALMNIALCKSYAATGQSSYLQMAENNMSFLLAAFPDREGLFYHTWKNGKATQPAFLDDYSYLIAALIELGQVSGNLGYLDRAKYLAEKVELHFSDEQSTFFYFTHKEQLDIPVRKKEIYDGATPSGNSMMAYNLYRLSILFDEPAWRERSARMVGSLGGAVFQHPTSFGIWLQLIFEQSSGTSEIAIIGKEWENYLENLLGIYISHKLALASANPLPGYPLLANKAESSITRIYLCENYACRQPVNTIPEFVSLLQAK